MAIQFKKGFAHRLAAATAVTLVAVGVLSVPDASAQVANTKHNLSGAYTEGVQGARNNFLNDPTQTQICVFCHTPHGAATDKAPLWQRNVGPNGSGTSDLTAYATYSSTNAGGAIQSTTMDSPSRPIGSVSVACLSCHDGTQAINTLANYPGSGSVAFAAGKWTESTTTNGKFKSDVMPNLGTDLKNDHPIGIHYGGGLDPANTVSGTKDPMFRKVLSVPGGVNGQPVWYVEASGNTARDKKDIQLFTRAADPTNATTPGDPTPYVECSSCHDPHMNEKLFLRVTAEGSAICLACHDK